jgi:membrane protein
VAPDQNVSHPRESRITARPADGGWYARPFQSVHWCDVKKLLSEASSAWSRHNAPRLGAALAFYTMLSLAPLSLLAVGIGGMAFGRKAAVGQIVWQAREVVGMTGANALAAILQETDNTRHGVIPSIIGIVVLLIGASAMFVELRDALNTIWEVPAAECSGLPDLFHIIKERLFSFGLVLAIGFLLLTSMAISATLGALGKHSASLVLLPEPVLQITNDLIAFLVLTGLFAAIYKVIPEVRLEWRDVLPGAAVTSVLFTLGKLAIGLYLGKATFASTYGAAASTVLFLLWVYYSSQVFFFGAEFTKSFANRYGSKPKGQRGALRR